MNNALSKCNNKINTDSITKINETLNNIIIPQYKVNNSYKGFSFQFITEENKLSSIKLKRRYVIAVNTKGIMQLSGKPTYSTNDELLIQELKDIIDRDNLIG